MSKNHVYRFCVKNQSGENSSVWRVWVTGNDVYAGHRGVTHSYKASFHADGECHSGLSAKIRKTLIGKTEWTGKSRHFDQWYVKNHMDKGESIELVEIIFPNSQLDKFEVAHNSKINWLECHKGKCVSIAILKSNIDHGQVFQSKEMAFCHLCTLPLKNGNIIVILYRLIEEEKQYLDFIKKNSESAMNSPGEKTYKSGSFEKTDPKIRAMLWYKQEDGRRIWIEASTRKNFVVIKSNK